MTRNRSQQLIIALIPILFLIILLFFNVKVFKENTLEGSNQLILLLAAFVAVLIGKAKGIGWNKVSEFITESISRAMPAILILIMIGALAGTWLISGVVPAMIFYGLKIIHPTFFLLAALVIGAIVSFATGSSWSTIATIGVALLGIGKTLGFSDGIVAGAIISGAYFGDKMSPLSDTTNLAPAVSGSDLFVHIRYMTVTTIPSLLIAAIIFLFIGFFHTIDSQIQINEVSAAIQSSFNVTPFLLLVPVFLVVIIIKKMPALPALLIGSLLGIVAGLLFQIDLIKSLVETDNTSLGIYKVLLTSMFGSIAIESAHPVMADLLCTSGMSGMLHTVWLILSAMVFGGAMEATGLLQTITSAIIRMAKSTGSLIFSTIVSSIFLNITAADQYISIIIPGRMYAESYRKQGLKPEVLSRTLEDGGTLTSVLVPWNTCGATQSTVLGVSTVDYLPYCFFNLVNPVIACIIGFAGYKIRKIGGGGK